MATRSYCRICGNEITKDNRVRSHLLTKSSYWGGNRLVVLDDGTVGDANKQAWETKLLCDQCDKKLGRWEDERKTMLTSEGSRPHQPRDEQSAIVGYGYNSEHIALAFLADILRCSLTSHPIYSGVSLGQKHTDRILEILREGRVDDFGEYAITLARYSSENTILDEMTEIPCRLRLGPCVANYYRTFMPGGWIWMIKVSQQSIEALDKLAITSSDIKVINLGDAGQSPDFEFALKNALIMKRMGRI